MGLNNLFFCNQSMTNIVASGAKIGVRTRDLPLTMGVLYQLSYLGISIVRKIITGRFVLDIAVTFCFRD